MATSRNVERILDKATDVLGSAEWAHEIGSTSAAARSEAFRASSPLPTKAPGRFSSTSRASRILRSAKWISADRASS